MAETGGERDPGDSLQGRHTGRTIVWRRCLRESGDIDIIVPHAKVLDAKASLVSLGYQPIYNLSSGQEKIYLRGTNHYNLHHSRKPISVEIHWDIVSPQLGISIDWQGVWQRETWTMFGSGKLRTLSSEDLFLVLSIHGTKHRWEMLKWLADLAQQIERYPQMDWLAIMDRAKQWRVERMVLLSVHLAYDLLEAQVPDSVLRTASSDQAVIGLTQEVLNVVDRAEGVPETDHGRIAYLMRTPIGGRTAPGTDGDC